MSKIVFSYLSLSFLFLSGFISAQSTKLQPLEGRDFGWSLTVSRSSKGRRDDTSPVPMVQGANHDDPAEIRVETELVLSDVLVHDKQGNPVAGLTSTDFFVMENGRPQKIEIFGYGSLAVPRSIILIIDHSLSQWRYMDTSINAAKVLVDSLGPNDRMAIVSDDVKLITDLTSDKAALKDGLESLRAKSRKGEFGKSEQYSALMAVLNERIRRDGTRNVVIFQSDGDQLGILRSDFAKGNRHFGFDDMVETAEMKGVTVYTVFTGAALDGLSKREMLEQTRKLMEDESDAVNMFSPRKTAIPPKGFRLDFVSARAKRIMIDEKAVHELAKRTGGTAQSLDSPGKASEIYENILTDIGRRYVIGYYPDLTETGRDKRRELRISVRKDKNYSVLGGRSYVAY